MTDPRHLPVVLRLLDRPVEQGFQVAARSQRVQFHQLRLDRHPLGQSPRRLHTAEQRAGSDDLRRHTSLDQLLDHADETLSSFVG